MSMSQMSIDYYSQSIFYFVGSRKHLLKDQAYHIYLFDNKIVMGQSALDPSPKYCIQLGLLNKITWVVIQKNHKPVIQAFSFLSRNHQKAMHAKPEDLWRFKQLLSCKVAFSYVPDFYELQFIIGKGSSAKVFQCVDLADNKQFAIKAIEKEYFQSSEQGMQSFEAEVSILQQLSQLSDFQSKYFMKIFEIFEGSLTVYLVTELMQGKTLQNEINFYKEQQKSMPQEKVKSIMLQLLQGVDVMHRNRIIHRDLKPDNIMFLRNQQFDTLKIVDFGLATRQDVEKFLYSKCGTPGYVAPEVLSLKQDMHTYSEVSDIFSCGVIFHKLLCGDTLFQGTTIEEVLKKNRTCKIDFYANNIIHISQSERQLLQAMLQKNPGQRVSAKAALESDYFMVKDNKSNSLPSSYVRVEQHRSSSPLLVHSKLPCNSQLVQQGQYDIDSQYIKESTVSPFSNIDIQKLKKPIPFNDINMIIQYNENQSITTPISSFEHMNDDIEENQILVQQLPLFKLTNSNNQAQKLEISSQNHHNQQMRNQSHIRIQNEPHYLEVQNSVKQRPSSQQQSQSNRSSFANLTSFYMKDPLSNLFKHLQTHSRTTLSQDVSPQKQNQDNL